MIHYLNQESFRDFGVLMPGVEGKGKKQPGTAMELQTGMTHVYRARGNTRLGSSAGMCVLSVSREDGNYRDFYLDKPVALQDGVWFCLTVLQDTASVRCMGDPEPVRITPAQNVLFVPPRLRMDALCTFFYQEREQAFFYPGESHPMLELTYVDQGTLHSVADGKDILLEQGDLVLYGPEQWHMHYSDIGVAPRYVTISFMMSGEMPDVLYNRKFRVNSKMVGLLQKMLQERERTDPYREDAILSMLRLLLVELLRCAGSVEENLPLSNSANNENEIIRKAQQFISNHVQEKLSVPMVAKGVDVSPSYLTALFHKHLQISPGEYIRRIKLQQSKQMIREGNLNFTEIAASLQYSTVHHFSRQFKEKFGLTPTEYARSVR